MASAWLTVGGAAAAFAAVSALLARSAAAANTPAARAARLPGSQLRFKATLTGYYPLAASTDAEKRMEGGEKDRLGKPLRYLEDAIAGSAPEVSVAADPKIFPYGQLLSLEAYPGIRFRVVDTGNAFKGKTKLYRADDAEPLDIAVRNKAQAFKLPKVTQATIHVGDHRDKDSSMVAVNQFRGQTVEVVPGSATAVAGNYEAEAIDVREEEHALALLGLE